MTDHDKLIVEQARRWLARFEQALEDNPNLPMGMLNAQLVIVELLAIVQRRERELPRTAANDY